MNASIQIISQVWGATCVTAKGCFALSKWAQLVSPVFRQCLGLLVLYSSIILPSRAEEERFSTLLQNSPFGAGPTVPSAEPAMEFRGYVGEDSLWIFSLAYLETDGGVRSAWVELDESYRDFIVRSFDCATETLQVDHQGHLLNLKLTKSSAQLMHVPERINSGVEPPAHALSLEHLSAAEVEIYLSRTQLQATPENHDSDQP